MALNRINERGFPLIYSKELQLMLIKTVSLRMNWNHHRVCHKNRVTPPRQ